jgi:DeoR/GlpR family transcriptional regulator of sugar metabolism
MAEAILKHTIVRGGREERLVPRSAALFLGVGTTVYFLAKELLFPAREQDGVEPFSGSIHTTNFEIAAMAYFASQRRFASASRLCLPGCELRWDTGNLNPLSEGGGLTIDTAIIGFSTLTTTPEFALYSDSDQVLSEMTNSVIRLARRVIVIGDHTKVDGELKGTQPIRLPTDGREISVVPSLGGIGIHA